LEIEGGDWYGLGTAIFCAVLSVSSLL
jgi:hypothetical protein